MTRIKSKKVAIIGSVGVALALLVAPLSLASAGGGFGPSACIQASGFDGEFIGHAGGCRDGAVKPVPVADTVIASYDMPWGWRHGTADIFAIDSMSGKETQISQTGDGAGVAYLQTGGSSTGWTIEARIGGEPVAQTLVKPSEVNEVDDGGWTHGEASVKLEPLPTQVEVTTSVYAEPKDNDHRNQPESFKWKIVDSSEKLVASGTGMTGYEATKQVVSKTLTIEKPRQVGVVDTTQLPKWTVSYEFDGIVYSTGPVAMMETRSAQNGPVLFRDYGLSYNGTRLTQSSAVAPRVQAQTY